MKTPPWDDGTLTPKMLAEYHRLIPECRRYCDLLASRSRAAARGYLYGRMEMRAELAAARKAATATVLAAVDSGERREREGGGS